MIDILVLPLLGAVIILFTGFVWSSWLRNKKDRALTLKDRSKDDDQQPGQWR